MESAELTRYIEAVYGFCLKRLHSAEDARDLAQEILLEALRGLQRRPVENFEPWLWQIARNRYARFLSGRRDTVSLEDSGLIDTLADEYGPDNSYECQMVFEALHTLARVHRELMVDFYVHGLSCEQIAQTYGLKPQTVRTRLFYGREKLKQRWQIKMTENRIYSHLDWLPSGNGDVDTSRLDRQVVRAILEACRETFLTADQLSLATGIPCLYLEDELAALVQSELVEQKGSCFRAGIIIHQAGFAPQAAELLQGHLPALLHAVPDVLTGLLPKVRALGFTGCDLPASRLYWSLIPMLMREACKLARKAVPETLRPVLPLRADGSRGWLCAYRGQSTPQRWFSGCNAYYRRGSRFRYYWSTAYYSEELNQLLRRLENAGPTQLVQREDLLAECIRCDLAVKDETGFRWQIPVLNAVQAQALQTLIKETAATLVPLLIPAARQLLALMKQDAPAHLHSQIGGIFGIDFNALIAMLCEALMEQGLLQMHGDGCFAGQVVMLTEGSPSFDGCFVR